jgi:predicted AlkP superfamily phosphohydrolase/phosphomutase
MSRTPLPNFEKLLREGSYSDLHSVYPYVTAPAWTTIFSGVNPGKHGIFEMFDVREDKIFPSNMRATDVPFLWDYLTWAGKRSLVVGVPFIFPAPKINGNFVTGRFSPRLSCYPEELASKFDFSGFNYDDLSMEEKTEKIVKEGADKLSQRILLDLEKRTATMMQLVDSSEWDVVILVDGLPDDLLHISYGDEREIDQMYLKLDHFLGLILQRMKSEDSLLVFSDHGFCKVENVFFINEWLLKKGFIDLHETRFSKFLMSLGISWDSFSVNGFTSRVFRFFLEHFPWAAKKIKDRFRSSMVFDGAEKLQAKVSAFSINEPLAWLRISKNYLDGIGVESLEADLAELRSNGVLKNVFRPDQIYFGSYVSQAPGQILVEGSSGCSIDAIRWNRRKLLGKPLLTKKGVHKREGILLTYGNIKTDNQTLARIQDLVPTVLETMKLPLPLTLDGKALIRKTSTPMDLEVLNVA